MKTAEHFDIVIHGATVVTVNEEMEVIPSGLICISDTRLARVEACADPAASLPPAEKTIDARGMIALPGLINTHTHVPMTIFRGLADDLPLQQWLEKFIFPAESRHIHPAAVRISTLLACAEMILSGTTTCCDGYFLEEDVARAVQQSGMRAVLGQGVIDLPAPGVPDPSENVAVAGRFVDDWSEVSPLLKPSIFCHSPYTCSAKTLQAAKRTADKKGVLFQVHAAETRTEREQIEKGQMSPIAYLGRLGLLDANTLLIHCVWIDESDIDIIAGSGASVAHCPESNMKLSSGIAPVTELLKAGVTVGLGTDGCASNNNLDLFQEMDTTAKLHKVNRLDPTAADAGSVLRMVTADAAAALGHGHEIGALVPGRRADLILLDARRPHLVPMYHPVSQVVYSAKGSDVHTSIINGRIVMENRRLIKLNLEQILDQANELGKTVMAAAG